MTTAEITNALATAHLQILHGEPITEEGKANFVKALAAVRLLPTKERIAISDAAKAAAATCIGKAA